MVRTKEGGSIISFVVIAVILAGLLIGGAYAIRHMDVQSSTSQPPQAPRQQTSSSPQSSPDSGSQTTTSSPAANNGSQQAAVSSNPSQTSPAASQLPQTGPEGFFGTIVALGLLSGVITAYARSRRLELQF